MIQNNIEVTFKNIFKINEPKNDVCTQEHVDYVNSLFAEAAQQDNHLLKSGKSVEQAVEEYLNMENM